MNKVSETAFYTDTLREWAPQPAAEFMAWMAEKIDAIPEPYRSSAMIEFSVLEYSAIVSLLIYYKRPETPDEEAARDAANRAAYEKQRGADEDQRAYELGLLARLRAKYPDAV